MNESWLPVVGFKGFYSVSDCGRVRSERRELSAFNNGTADVRYWEERILNAGDNGHGYPRVVLSRNGKRYYRLIHLLMLEAFKGPRPVGHYGLHDDDVKTNNVLTNLEWGTPSKNSHDRVRNGHCPKANQVACIHGHEFTEANTIRRKDRPGTRECRQCNNDRMNQRNRKKANA